MIVTKPKTFRLPSNFMWGAIGAMTIASAACGGTGTDPNPTPAVDAGPGGGDGDGGGGSADQWDQRLNEREYDYSAALRTASLRLRGELPSLTEIKFVGEAADSQKKAAYEAIINSYLDDPAYSQQFGRQVFRFWQDAFKMGGTQMLDSAPAFAAQLTLENRDFTELFTATAGNCPTFDQGAGTATAQDCQNGVPAHAGVLSSPGVNAHFVSNLAFRRVRWVQETFDCTAFPAEFKDTPEDVGGAAPYVSPWPFESISGSRNGGEIDFHDASAVVCANCHGTMNHMAPLFGNFDENGQYQQNVAVTKPTEGTPLAQRTDWLPAGEPSAWRYGVQADDLPALGQAMANDPYVAECMVARTWNWALGRQDIVDSLAIVPTEVIAEQTALFQGSGHNFKELIRMVFTSEDFVRY